MECVRAQTANASRHGDQETLVPREDSCDSDGGGGPDGPGAGGGLTDEPKNQDPVVTLPITATDVPNLNLLYLGKTREQAFAISTAQKHILRVVSVDGKSLAVTP